MSSLLRPKGEFAFKVECDQFDKTCFISHKMQTHLLDAKTMKYFLTRCKNFSTQYIFSIMIYTS